MDWSISKHSMDRIRQRFKLYFKSYHFDSYDATRMLLYSLLDRAKLQSWWLNCPFYVNKVQSIYGPIVAYYVETPTTMFFIVDITTNTVITVVKEFDPRKIKMDSGYGKV